MKNNDHAHVLGCTVCREILDGEALDTLRDKTIATLKDQLEDTQALLAEITKVNIALATFISRHAPGLLTEFVQDQMEHESPEMVH